MALAGFARVVTACRAQSVHEWVAIDKFRLRLLLTNSILPLAYRLFVLAMLQSGRSHFTSGSGALLLWLPMSHSQWELSNNLTSLRQVQSRAAPANRIAFYLFFVLGAIFTNPSTLQYRELEWILAVFRWHRRVPAGSHVPIYADAFPTVRQRNGGE